jgi:hypothetical protein
MPVRSEFTIEQFEEAFQKLAHEQPKFHKISTETMTINFYYDAHGKPRRISLQVHKHKPDEEWYEGEYWGFTIERKLYNTSPHSTKIDYGPSPEVEAKLKGFLKSSCTDKRQSHVFR